MKTSITMLAALAAVPFVAGAFVENAAAKKIKASRQQVSKACSGTKGAVEWGTGASNSRYGCGTPQGKWIECDRKGNCESGGPNGPTRE